MTLSQTIAASREKFQHLRRDLHRHPELQFKEHRTAEIVARELESYGYKVTTRIAETGVIATLTQGQGSRAIAIRADMDALPITETTNLPYASTSQGVMHACGHDGHTTTLLAAAKAIAERKNFSGTLHLIFQPAEEDISGAKRMVDEGVFERFPVDGIFAFHNLPGLPVGQIVVKPGPITARADIVAVTVRGTGGHGALPHLTADPIVAASGIVMALQTAVSRNSDPNDVAVVTVGAFNGGILGTIIPDEVKLLIGVRTVTPQGHTRMSTRIPQIIRDQAKSFGCEADVLYGHGIAYPAGFNDATLAASVRDLALSMGQLPSDVDLTGPMLFSEDFAFMQEKVKGCYFGIGNGNSRNLHDPGYDFNDGLLVKGAEFWTRLVEKELQAT
jgi:hippurate hydrolase